MNLVDACRQALSYIDSCPDCCPNCGAERGSECDPDEWCGAMRSALDAQPKTMADMVAEFHHAAGVPILDTPQVPSDDRVRLRLRLIAEEFVEYLRASFWGNPTAQHVISAVERMLGMLIELDPSPNLIETVDAIIDMGYINHGTLHEFGVTAHPVEAEVHRSNMAKFADGVNLREDGKVVKPPGWTPPDIHGVLKQQGWRG